MTFTSKNKSARHAGRRPSPGATTTSRVLDPRDDIVAGLPPEAGNTSAATRTVLRHTSAGWNSLRHAC
jgi:hypothetical protein